MYFTAHVSFVSYAAGQIGIWEFPPRALWPRLLWSCGWGCLLIHSVLAFGLVHHWSHSAMALATATRTAEVTGWGWEDSP